MYNYTNLLDDDNVTGRNGNYDDNDVPLIITLILVTVISSRNRISLHKTSHAVHTSAKQPCQGFAAILCVTISS